MKKQRKVFVTVMNKNMKIDMKPIGLIHSPYKNLKDIPCQAYKSNKTGYVEVFKEFSEGLKDINGFSHIILVYYFQYLRVSRQCYPSSAKTRRVFFPYPFCVCQTHINNAPSYPNLFDSPYIFYKCEVII